MTTPFSWYNPDAVAGAVAAQGAGADGRTVLQGANLESTLNPLTGVTANNNGSIQQWDAGSNTEAGNTNLQNYYSPGTYTNASGQTLYGLLGPNIGTTYADQAAYDSAAAQYATQLGLDPSKQYVTSQFENPSSPGGKDMVTGVYQLNSDGSASPVGANSSYAPGWWVDGGRQGAIGMGAVLTGGLLAGGALGTAATPSADLATAGAESLPVGASGTGTAVAAGGSGAYANSVDALAANGGDTYGLMNANPALAGINAPVGSTGALNAAATAAGGSGLGGSLGQYLNIAAKALPVLAGAAQLIKGSSTPSTATTGTTAASTAAPLPMGAASRYTNPGAFSALASSVPSRPGYTHGPSLAVNLNDPSAAEFGYGKVPTYYAQPGTVTVGTPATQANGYADGGGVQSIPSGYTLDDYGNTIPLDGASGPAQAPGYSTDSDTYGALNQLRSDPSLAGVNTTANPNAADPAATASPLETWWKNYTGQGGAPAADPNRVKLLQAALINSRSSDQTKALLAELDKAQAPNNQAQAQNQLLLGLGGLGALASLLKKKSVAPGYQTPAQVKASLPMSGALPASAGVTGNIGAYFGAPATRFVPGTVNTGGVPLPSFASGGRAAFDTRPPMPGMDGSGGFNPQVHGAYVAHGAGSGQDDRVPARLSPGEYVMDADTVASLGDGSNAHGAAQLDKMREAIRAHKRSAPATEIPPQAMSPFQYLAKGNQ